MKTEIEQPSAQGCLQLLRSLQQLVRARRRATKNRQEAASWMVLSALADLPAARISGLAELLMIDISAASRQVAMLESEGLVARVRDAVDHRAQLVRLSPAGRAALTEAGEAAGSDMARRIANWSESDVRLLTGLVQRLANDLIASEPGCAKSHPSASIAREPVGAPH